MLETRDVVVDAVLGPVRWCPVCEEYWPDDEDFYVDDQPTCRACIAERRDRRRRQQAEAARRYRRRRRVLGR